MFAGSTDVLSFSVGLPGPSSTSSTFSFLPQFPPPHEHGKPTHTECPLSTTNNPKRQRLTRFGRRGRETREAKPNHTRRRRSPHSCWNEFNEIHSCNPSPVPYVRFLSLSLARGLLGKSHHRFWRDVYCGMGFAEFIGTARPHLRLMFWALFCSPLTWKRVAIDDRCLALANCAIPSTRQAWLANKLSLACRKDCSLLRDEARNQGQNE